MISKTHTLEVAVALRNLFAMGCLLVAQGQREQGLKLCNDVVRTLDETGHKTYLDQLFAALGREPIRIARSVGPSRELLDILSSPAVGSH
ncbi:hypothetical protein I0D00_01010 [Pseudomonas lalucatii]|uniref:Tetratricopeptide repeat protein n=1 Tax=Pseudomonas lalucatii TaxID=1424203 RepID=A0ABS5PVG4_9PSED|nr:hypothetical protein [Pseudomonas lalucatii]MBS7724605.1 hypothetical protein [Pseudomonas lalucatii]QVM88976.1 hypothetical protein I0D68_19950 [Pseudomonas lalucatii]